MTLLAIVIATLAAGIGSVWLAAGLMSLGMFALSQQSDAAPNDRAAGQVGPQHLLSMAAGALLATAFMHLLPEAFEQQASAKALFATLLVALVFFFLLDKAELWHHGHEHHHDHDGGADQAEPPGHRGHRGPPHEHAGAHHEADHGGHHRGHHAKPAGAWAVLTGDSVHCFGDGILIASAFVADFRLGVIAALAVLAHEVPHHIGDLVVLRQTSNRSAALLKVSLAGALTMLGGITGWWLVDQLHDYLPYFLVVASSSFVYVALADLIPQLQKRLGARETAAQVIWLLVGIGLVSVVSTLAHVH